MALLWALEGVAGRDMRSDGGGVAKLDRSIGSLDCLMGEPSSLPPPGTTGGVSRVTFFAPKLQGQ